MTTVYLAEKLCISLQADKNCQSAIYFLKSLCLYQEK